MFVLLLRLSSERSLPGVSISWPDDTFFGYVCAAKDSSAEFFSILTSTINGALQKAQTPVNTIQSFANVDASANAVLSLTTTSVTGFLHQAALLPLFAMVVGRQTMMCQVTGMLAVVEPSGFHVSISSYELAASTDAIAGQCLTMRETSQAQQTSTSSGMTSLSGLAGTALAARTQLMANKYLEPVTHAIDGGLAYLSGLVGSFGNVLQSFDLRHCLLPDASIAMMARCACGDEALSIPPARRNEGLAQKAFWCTGTLAMVNTRNEIQLVYNPYTYQELQTLLRQDMDAYLECASGSFNCQVPEAAIFTAQGVSMLAVLTECRQNYVSKQWDAGAYAIYDPDALRAQLQGSVLVPALDPSDGAGQCLLDAARAGALNSGCLADYSRVQGWTDSYWAYEHVDTASAALIDACVVFSGPAANSLVPPAQSAKFRDCLMGYATPDACDLSGFVWSPGSGNSVPVASRHVIASAPGTALGSGGDVVQRLYAQARAVVLAAAQALGNYSNSALEVGFFSSEGDVVHQLLDCVFLGPYARLDYWPQPRCDESARDDCLVGPYWARDEARGAGRGVDVEGCPKTGSLPFTCGSPSRRAMVRYFVNQYLLQGKGGADLIVAQVREWIAGVQHAWGSVAAFGCDCPDGGNGPHCCAALAENLTEMVPRALRDRPSALNTTSVLNAMERLLRVFHTEAALGGAPWHTYLDAAEKAKYDWAQARGAHWVQNDARFDTARPAMSYTAEEAMSPPHGPGQRTLWESCHGAIRQVLFTLPVNGTNGSLVGVTPDFAGGGPDAVAAQVQKIVAQAFASSPLFRHYHPRHHPSNSTLCARKAPRSAGARGSAGFSSYSVDGTVLFDGGGVQRIGVLGADTYTLGDWGQSCFCGWDRDGDWCVVPAAIAAQVPGTNNNSRYRFASQDRAALGDLYRAEWPCPELELSEHLGFLDGPATEQWLRGNRTLTTSGDTLLRYGPGGLKVGNLPGSPTLPESTDLGEVLARHLHPRRRSVDPALGAIYSCDPPDTTRSLLDAFVDDLFPMAQGVSDSGAVSYCLRYAIELARLRALELILGRRRQAGLDWDPAEMVRQKAEATLWRQRCGSQVQLVSLCSAMGLYRPNLFAAAPCSLDWTVVPAGDVPVYVTQQCLVSVGGVFYDPCACRPDWCVTRDSPLQIQQAEITGDPSCRVALDPRDFVLPSEMGWWPEDGEGGLGALGAARNAWLREPWNLLNDTGFAAAAAAAGGATGNVPAGAHWATAEGFMNASARYCDMVADYWPEDLLFPVGYHVTAPCHHSDAGYRTFDNVFAYELQDAQPTMVYFEDQTRDNTLVDSHFGAGGFCRTTTFGFDVYETNTMRVCTRVSDAEDVDVHVPPAGLGGGALGAPQCSASSTELPWADYSYYGHYDAAFFSVGTVPSLPSPGDSFYPPSANLYWRLGPVQRMEGGQGWGAACGDFNPPACNSSAACAAGFLCRAGVCMMDNVVCTNHSDCPGGGMCSGVGTCVQPQVVVLNRLAAPAEFRAHTTSCPGDSYSMRGASPWGHVPDLLNSHGMCKYMHWAEYLYTLDQCPCLSTDGAACVINATACPYYNFDLEAVQYNFWVSGQSAPKKFKMLPTTCDRDYERLSLGGVEMRVCLPRQGSFTIVDPNRNFVSVASYGDLIRLYDADQHTIPILRMPFRTSPSYGFLGASAAPVFKSCGQISQCFPDVFTENGVPRMVSLAGFQQANRTVFTGQAYDPQDAFRCGFIGYYANGQCNLDRKLFPLYHLLCDLQSGLPAQCSGPGVVDAATRIQVCSTIQATYQPDIGVIHDVNVVNLARLFQIFNAPTTMQKHIDLVTCMSHVYTTISKPPFTSRGLYFPFDFTSYEFPFAWFYQCMVHQHIAPTLSDDRGLWACAPYARWQPGVNPNKISTYVPISGREDDLATYVATVRGGFPADYVAAYASLWRGKAVQTLSTCVNSLALTTWASGVDGSSPVCHRDLGWSLDSYSYYERLFVSSMVANTCQSGIQSIALTNLKDAWGMDRPPTQQEAITRLTRISGAAACQTASCGTAGTPSLLQAIYARAAALMEQRASPDALKPVPVTTRENAGPVRYDNSLPSSPSDPLWRGVLNSLGPDYYPSTDQPDATVYRASNCPAGTAVKDLFTAADDPNVRAGGASAPRVKYCPVYQTGKLNCHYEPYTLRGRLYKYDQDDVRASNNAAALANYFDGLVGAVTSCYAAAVETPPPLQATALPWFAEEEAQQSFAKPFPFSLSAVRRYNLNINPTVDKPVMCTVAGQKFNATQCTDPNFLALRAHVQAKYAARGPPVIPSQSQLTWPVDRGLLTTGAVFSYASTERKLSRQYLRSMMDDDMSCTAINTTTSQRVCRVSGDAALGNITAVNPWMAGYWNPWATKDAGCDVNVEDISNGYTEVVDVACSYAPACPSVVSGAGYNFNMPGYTSCTAAQNTKPSSVDVDDSTPYNLCRRQNVEDPVCGHDQGMLGGTDGLPAESSPGGDMFNLSPFTSLPPNSDRGLFGNPLFAGGAADYGFLRVPESHLGTTHIGIEIAPGGDGVPGTMRVARLPLNPRASAAEQMGTWGSADVADWVQQLPASWAADHARFGLRNRYLEGKAGWDCPLKRRAFYAGNVSGFGPMLPDGLRSRRVFGGITGGLDAHPTQTLEDASASFGRYHTTNGFCYCPVSEGVSAASCSVRASSRDHDCSLWNTLQTLQGKQWGWSYTFPPRTPGNDLKRCTMQLDWPFVGGALRDGDELPGSQPSDTVWQEASDVEGRRCHVLDRMQRFQYSYIGADELRTTGETTLARGACHTGRAARRATVGADGQRCVRYGQGQPPGAERVVCTDGTSEPVVRPASATPDQTAANAGLYRRACSACSPVPRFRTRGGAPLPQESSFGVPYRRSAERVLAADLKAALCREEPACLAALNLTAWAPGEFLRTYLTRPERLLLLPANLSVPPPALDASASMRAPDPPDDAPLWQRPWVYCGSAEALASGANCTGAIPKARWRADRPGTCYAAVQNALRGGPDPMATTSVCNIDPRLTDLCAAIETAKTLVAQANCIASGAPQCALQEYVYTPGTWEVSNKEFVHSTVRNFYRQIDGCTGSDPAACVCPNTANYTRVAAGNSASLRECPAVPLYALQGVLNSLRDLAFRVAQIVSSVVSIAVSLLRTLLSQRDLGAVRSQMLIEWASLKRLLSGVVDSLSDLVADVILFKGTLGPFVAKFLAAACEYLNTLHEFFRSVWCRFVVDFFPTLLGALKDAVTWMEIGFQTLNDFMRVVLKDFLPMAFVRLADMGYTKYFKSKEFDNKRATYTDVRRESLLVARAPSPAPMNAAARAAAGAEPNRQVLRGFGTAVKITRVAGAVGTTLGVVNDILSYVQEGQEAALIARAMENFPDDFTSFNFEAVYMAIDDVVEFLAKDLTCFGPDHSGTAGRFLCTLAALPQLEGTDAYDIAPYASQCWAEAQTRQLGVTTLYACTGSSTCLASPTGSETVACAECPLPPPGYNPFGCNTLLQKCVCGTQSLAPGRCVGQRECGAGRGCSLLTSLADSSFGAIQCDSCPAQPVCLVQGATNAGECTCLPSARGELDLCAGPAGEPTRPQPGHLCGYSHTPGTYFFWDELALILCVKAETAVCAEVISDEGVPIFMSVATSVVQVQLSFSGRRLLAETAPPRLRPPSPFAHEPPADLLAPAALHAMLQGEQWNHTGALCATLAHAYQRGDPLGPSDEGAAHACAYWRQVARQVIADFDLEPLRGRDTFLLSADDFAAALGGRGVAEALWERPQALVAAAMYSEWLKPARAFVRAILGANLTRLPGARRTRTRRPPEHAHTHTHTHTPEDAHTHTQPLDDAHTHTHAEEPEPTHTHTHARRLLSLLSDARDAVRSSDVGRAVRGGLDGFALPVVSPRSPFHALPSWLRGPNAWPPPALQGSCPPLYAVLAAGTRTLAVVGSYYAHYAALSAPANRSATLAAVLPSFRAPDFQLAGLATAARTAPNAAFDAALALLQLSRRDVAAFFLDPCGGGSCARANRLTAIFVAETVSTCSFESVMYCGQSSRGLLPCAVLMFLAYIAVAAASRALGVPAVGTFFFYAYPFLTIWYAYGIAPACFPLVPTCLVDDLLESVTRALPHNLTVPALLRCPNQTDCLRSCSELGFASWEAPAVYALCEAGLCPALRSSGWIPAWDSAFQDKAAMAASPDADAYRVCALVTMVSAAPLLLLAAAAAVLVPSACISLLQLAAPAVTLAWQVLSFNHAGAAAVAQ